MISSYRLGDLFFLGSYLTEVEKSDLLREHPNSIGAEFILSTESNVYKKIKDITINHIDKYIDLLPKDICDSNVIHVRIGDVVSGTTDHEISKRPLSISYYENLLNNNNDKTYIIGKPFFAHTSSRNYEQCINESTIYLQNLLNKLNAHHFDGGNADIDLCCAVLSKKFVQGRGYFSNLIVCIRELLGKYDNIKTYVGV